MAEAKNLTAEQQLLQLIESQDKQAEPAKEESKAPAPPPKPAAVRRQPVISADLMRGKIAFLQDNIKDILKKGDVDAVLGLVNNVLIAVICLFFVFLAIDLVFKQKKTGVLPNMENLMKQKTEKSLEIDMPKDSMYYMEKLKKRDIFKPKPKELPKVEAPKIPVSNINDTAKDLKLVGLSPSEDGDGNIAMIENTKAVTTHFLKKGDTILGLTVTDITMDKVVLSDGKAETELK